MEKGQRECEEEKEEKIFLSEPTMIVCVCNPPAMHAIPAYESNWSAGLDSIRV
jgi:hypothetical protein